MHRRMLNRVLGFALLMPAAVLVPGARARTDDDIDLAMALAPRIVGDPDARVTLTEFYSLTCPQCARLHAEIYPQLHKVFIHTGRVKLDFRDFPLDALALRAAALARCLPAKRHAAMIDVLLKQQASWAQAEDPLESLVRIGRLAGLDGTRARACMSNTDLLDGILNLRLEASRTLEINATPTLFLNGDKIEVQFYDDLAQLLVDAGA